MTGTDFTRFPAPKTDEAGSATRAELHAIQVSTEALAALKNTDAHARVVRYLVDRFGLGPTTIYPHRSK